MNKICKHTELTNICFVLLSQGCLNQAREGGETQAEMQSSGTTLWITACRTGPMSGSAPLGPCHQSVPLLQPSKVPHNAALKQTRMGGVRRKGI